MSSPSTCAHCKTPSSTLKLCSSCKRVSYCNKDCQKADWKDHKHNCRSIVQPSDRMQIILKTKDGDFYKPRAFPIMNEIIDESKRTGRELAIPLDCVTEQRTSNGNVVVVIDEDKWQEKQAREAAKRAFKGGENSVTERGDGGEEGEKGKDSETNETGQKSEEVEIGGKDEKGEANEKRKKRKKSKGKKRA